MAYQLKCCGSSTPLKFCGPFQIGHFTEPDQASCKCCNHIFIWHLEEALPCVYILPLPDARHHAMTCFCLHAEVIKHECNLKFTFNFVALISWCLLTVICLPVLADHEQLALHRLSSYFAKVVVHQMASLSSYMGKATLQDYINR